MGCVEVYKEVDDKEEEETEQVKRRVLLSIIS